MKKISILLLLFVSLCLGSASISNAKWWIFGKNTEGIQINYLYLNKISFDNSVDPNITIFKGNLIDGNLIIKGKASTSKGKIGAVQITLDNKETWKKARLSQNGSFEFIFTPRLDETYEIFIKILDTTGKTNDVDSTFKAVKISKQDLSGLVRKSLEKLFQAYQEQDPTQFMLYVSPNFETDEALLDTAIRKDFNTFDHIQIHYIVNSIMTGSQGRSYVSLNYNRSVISTKSGDMLTDYGATEFIFSVSNGIPKLARIKNPLLFGLSDASNIATGTINSGTNDPILLVDEYGNVVKEPFKNAITVIEGGNSFSSGNSGSSNITTGTVLVTDPITSIAGYSFSHDQSGNTISASELGAPAGSYVKNLSSADIDTLTSVSVTAADGDPIMIFPAASNNSYAVRFSDGNYMLIQHMAGSQIGATIKYRLQTNGTSSF